MPIWCHFCREPVVPGSLYCPRHRQQAALFSRTFGPPPILPKAESPATSAATQSNDPGLPPPPPASASECGVVLRDTFSALVTAQRASPTPDRWPQISLYLLNRRLLA